MNTPQTRQELLVLKKKKKSISKSKSLLEDKKNSLIKMFMSYIKETISLRSEFDEFYTSAYKMFRASSEISNKEYYTQLGMLNQSEFIVTGNREKHLGVELMKLKLEKVKVDVNYSMVATNKLLDSAVSNLEASSYILVDLMEKEYATRSLSKEIIKLRRRVNSLEHIIIPTMEENITKIEFKLEQLAQSMTVMLMKVKAKAKIL